MCEMAGALVALLAILAILQFFRLTAVQSPRCPDCGGDPGADERCAVCDAVPLSPRREPIGPPVD